MVISDEAVKIEGFPPNSVPNTTVTGTYIPNTEGFPPSQMHHSVSTPEGRRRFLRMSSRCPPSILATHYNQPQPNVVYLSPNAFGPRPTNVICPHCQHQVLTNTRPVSGLLTWLLCLLLIIFGYARYHAELYFRFRCTLGRLLFFLKTDTVPRKY